MDPVLYQKVENIYYQVLDEKPKNLEEYIHEKAGGDVDIIEKILELLAIDDYKTYNKTSDNVLAKISDIISDDTGAFDSDRYELIEKIGEGGMGSVYLANRIGDDIEQQVAIKLINSIFTTDANIERFKQERQILASLSHKNIARFIDAGTTESGLLFVVMEYVEGTTLKHYCLENQLTIKQKLLLYLQLCNAIEYAHQNFIIHRDLKPGNIIVTKAGKLKLLDFGIAKLIDKDSQLLAATVTKIMTPAYASPEQLMGKQATIQSDIYALGIILFEIIIGSRPYEDYEADSHSFQVKVLNGITSRPSQFIVKEKHQYINTRDLKGDIDAILTKVINPDIKHRYSIVLELKQEINNYMQGYPVTAHNPNALYFLKLFILRNKLIVSLTTVSLAMIIGFSIYSFFQNEKLKTRGIQLSQQRDKAVLQAKKAKLASNFLLESFQTADPTRTFGEKLTIKKVMKDSYEKLKKEPLEDKNLNAELFHTISKAFYGMDAIDLAFEAANKGLKEIKNIENGDVLLKVKLLIALGKGFFVKREYKEALSILDMTEKLCNDNPQIKDCLLDEVYLYVSKTHNNIGDINLAKNEIIKALDWLKYKNIKGMRNVLCLLVLAKVENSLKNYTDAHKILNEIRSILSIDNPIESYYYIHAGIRIANILRLQKKFDDAKNEIVKLIELINTQYGQKNVLYIEALISRAKLHVEMKEYQAAKSLYEKIIDIKKGLNFIYKADLNNLGNLYYHYLKEYNKAIELYEKVLKLDPLDNKIHNQRSAVYRRNLGMAYYRNKQYLLSLHYLRKAKTLHEALPFDDVSSIKGLNDWIEYILQKQVDKHKN